MQTSTIRPGLLVSLKTSVSGNVAYRKQDIETDHVDADGARRAKWETERTVNDPAEFEEATKIRSKARSLIGGLCVASSFGLLCPLSRSAELSDAVREAQALASDFNARAKLTRVAVYVIAGQIAADDVEATKAINSEVRDLLDRMEAGVRNLDVEAIREAANRARSIGTMVSADASARLQKAIDTARSAARQIVKAGETAAAEVDARAIRAITESRVAFLDLDDANDVQTPSVTGRAIDFDAPSEPIQSAPMMAAPAMLDLF
jgi:hypothetical protein